MSYQYLQHFPQIEINDKINNITFIGEEHSTKFNEHDYYLLAKFLRTQYKSCIFSCFKTEILIEDFNISSAKNNENHLFTKQNHLSYIADYLTKNNCNVTKCDYRKSFPFYMSIIKKNIKDIVEILQNVSTLIEHIEKKDFPLMLIHRIKQMNNAMDYFSLQNNNHLIRIIRSIINKNINGKSYKFLITQYYNELKSALIVFQKLDNDNRTKINNTDIEMWNNLKHSFDNFCDAFPLFFSFILDWVFLFYIEKYKRSNIVIYAGSQHIKSLLETLKIKEKQHKLTKHMDF